MRGYFVGQKISFSLAVSLALAAFALIAPRGAVAQAAGSAPASAATPNVVMILSDDQGWTDYGFMGSEIRTPNLDALAAGGALFTRGYVPCSLCRCSLATIVTGLYAHQHGITSNDPPQGADRHGMLKYIERAKTLPAILGARGYRSFQAGKWWEGSYQMGGFTDGMTTGDEAHGGRHGDEGLKIGREGLTPVAEFLDRSAGSPFFLWYAPMLPHTPHNPPERILKKYAKPGRPETIARYMAMCEWFDETCGELIALLEARGLRANTLIVFAADNGWIQKPDAPDYDPRSKRSPYDGGLRTPIILNMPGRIAPRRDDREPITTLDLAPTILRMCGAEPLPEMPGLDLAPALAGKPGASLGRASLFGEVFSHNAADIDRPATSLLFRWTLRDPWKLILPKSPDAAPELYRIAEDPFEKTNLAPENPDVIRDLTKEINAWWTPDDKASPR